MATNNAINNPNIMFFVSNNAGSAAVTGDGTPAICPFDTVIYDTSNSYDIATSTYVVPRTGRYFVSAVIAIDSMSLAQTDASINITQTGGLTLNGTRINPSIVWGATSLSLSVSGLMNLTAGTDLQVGFYASGGAKDVSLPLASTTFPLIWFCGYLID